MKKVLISLVGLIILGGIIVTLYVSYSPQFGGKNSGEFLQKIRGSKNFDGNVFLNLEPTTMDLPFKVLLGVIWDFALGTPNQSPDWELPVTKISTQEFENIKGSEIIWFGHSAFLLKLGGKNILLDPMLGDVPAPHPWFGTSRFSKSLPMEIEDMPRIDAVVISHDHYDHLDYPSIVKLMDKTDKFLLPLGVGAHFRSWGIEEDKIVELDWWESVELDSLEFVFTPSRHFSGRGLSDRFKTLWGSWVINSKDQKIYFSGDGGYGKHFSEIGEKYGPFDLALVECGQYDPRWSQIHMAPEESAQAGVDLHAKKIMPIHWGAFALALHSWTDPIERILVKGKEINIPIIAPQIGERVVIKDPMQTINPWWKH